MRRARAQLSAFVHRASALGENSFDSSTTVQDTWFQLAISAHSDHYKHLEDGLRFLSEIPVSLRCSDADIHEERALYLSDWRSLQVRVTTLRHGGAPSIGALTCSVDCCCRGRPK